MQRATCLATTVLVALLLASCVWREQTPDAPRAQSAADGAASATSGRAGVGQASDSAGVDGASQASVGQGQTDAPSTNASGDRIPPANRPPNVVLIVADDLGYADLGCYGGQQIRTPHIDRLARQGVKLTSFYVTWPACTPSRGSLLTGRYPQRNGTYDMFRNEAPDYYHKYTPEEYRVTFERVAGMDEREVLLPAMLKRAGYVSGIFGKWDLGVHKRYLPPQRGFDEFYGFVNTGIDYHTHERYGVPSMYHNNDPTEADKGTYATDLFKREALRFIEQHKDEPFFLYVPFNAPHVAASLDREQRGSPQAPPEYLARYDEPDPDAEPMAVRRHTRRQQFMASVTAMDDAIGAILRRLDEQELTQNTIVLFMSDNGAAGGGDNGRLRGSKGWLYEGGIRVPCIVRWPDRVPDGAVSDEFLTALEIVPTLCEATGAGLPADVVLDGFDMSAVLAGEAPSPRREMFWQMRGDKAARVGAWKWVESGRGSGLYDLTKDLGEQRDLSEQFPAVLALVRARFAAWEKLMESAESRGPFRDY